MMEEVRQREYIQNFLDFTRGLLITEPCTWEELDLILANAEILIDRIKKFKSGATTGLMYGPKMQGG